MFNKTLFVVTHKSDTAGWIYKDFESAEKRLTSSLKMPSDPLEYCILEVTVVSVRRQFDRFGSDPRPPRSQTD